MKKLILFLTLIIAFAFTANAQFKAEEWVSEYTGISTDTVGSGVTTWNKAFTINKENVVYYNLKVKVQDVTAGATCTVALQGKYFAADDYSTISTQTWAGGGTDTTFVFTGGTTPTAYRFLNILVTRTANKAKVTYVKVAIKR